MSRPHSGQPAMKEEKMNSSSRDHAQSTTAGHGALPMPSPDLVPFDEDVLFWAFRYALGRMTYAVSDVAMALHAHRRRLSPQMRERVCLEITECERREALGHSCDARAWIEVREALSALGDGTGRAPSPPVIDGESSRDEQNQPPKPTTTMEGEGT